MATGPARLRLGDAPSGQALGYAAPQLAQLTEATKRRTALKLTGRGGIATGHSAALEPRRLMNTSTVLRVDAVQPGIELKPSQWPPRP